MSDAVWIEPKLWTALLVWYEHVKKSGLVLRDFDKPTQDLLRAVAVEESEDVEALLLTSASASSR